MIQKLLNRDPKALVLERINATNPNYEIKDDDVELDDVSDNGNGAFSQNTRARVLPVEGGTIFRDSSYVFYDRVPIDAIFKHLKPRLLIDESIVSTKDLIPLIQSVYGVVIEEGAYVDTEIDRSGEQPYSFKLELKNNSIAWSGNTTFLLIEPSTEIDDVVESPVLHGVRFPFFTTQRKQALTYSYNVNASGIRDELKNLIVGSSLSSLISMWNNVSPTVWQYTKKANKSNLYGARIIATGDVDDLMASGYPVNPAFEHAVVVRLDPEYCTDFGGILLLQYN